jgi:7,8-dihydroneopterin aldolase/epimerase/oxygenase
MRGRTRERACELTIERSARASAADERQRGGGVSELASSPSSDRIVLRGLRARGHHGVYAEERASGQTFLVDLVLHVDTRAAARSDDVADTVHYGELAADVVAVVVGEPVNLLETLAARIADVCLRRPRVETVEVTIHKPEAPVGVPFDDIEVTIARGRA